MARHAPELVADMDRNTHSLLTPRAAYSSMYESKSLSHLLIVPSKRKKAGELGLARLYVIETNNMTPDMIVLGV